MKRKKLQALCKKHGLPANVTNVKLADSLAAFFKVLLISLNLFFHFFALLLVLCNPSIALRGWEL